MNNRFVLFFVSVWLLLLAGCASVTPPPTAPPEAQAQQPGAGIVIEPVPNSEMSGNRAVVALLDRAQADDGAGKREAAEGSLERALRIEPRNPWLWHQLAQLRLDQGQYAQAVTLSRKSNSFAGHQNRLLAANWQVIGNARVAQGDSAGAEQAFKRAAEFVQQDKAEHGSGFFNIE
jgi:tetratricopeptide (TPR) repeat protein